MTFRPLGLHQVCARCVHAYNHSHKNVDKHLPASGRHPVYKTGHWLLVANVLAFGRVRVGVGGLRGVMTLYLLRVKVHALWVQRSELFYPVAFPSSSQTFVKASQDFKDCNPEIVQGMAWVVEIISYWFLCAPVCDVVALSIKADVEGFLCLSNVLLSALPAFEIMFLVLQVAVAHTLKVCFVIVLWKLVPVWIWLQVRQRLASQGLLPLAGCSPVGLSSAMTKRSRNVNLV